MNRLPRNSHGFMQVEMFIVSVLLLVMSGAVAMMVIRTQRAQNYVERNASVTTGAQDVIERMREDVSSSARLFQGDADGIAYLTGLDRASLPGLSSARMPKLDPTGTFRKDAVGLEKTGNVLLFAKHDRTDTFDVGTIASPEFVRVNVYRLVCYYLRKVPPVSSDQPAGMDIARWVSAPLVDLDQVEQVEDVAKRAQLLMHFYDGTNPVDPMLPYPAARILWRPRAAFATAFKEIDAGGNIVDPMSGFQVASDPGRTRRQFFGYRHLAVAQNSDGPGRGLCQFALQDDSGDGFPHGFEVQIIGTASARQVLLRLVVTSAGIGVDRSWIRVQSIVDARDA